MSDYRCRLLPGILCLASSLLPAQLQRGHSLTTVQVQQGGYRAEIWDLDHATGTAQRLSIPTLLTNQQRPEALLMDSSSANSQGALTKGWVVSVQGNVFAISLTGRGVTAQALNTTPPVGAGPSQLAQLGKHLYFTTRKGNGADGVLQRIPTTGGAVEQLADLAAAGARFPVNACCISFGRVFCATYNAGPFFGGKAEILYYDLQRKSAARLLEMPPGLFGTGQGSGIVALAPIPGQPLQIAAFGVYGEYVVFDGFTGKIISRQFTGTDLGSGGENRSNCAAYDPVSGHWWVGTRDGAIDAWVDGHSAERVFDPVGSASSAVLNTIHGIYHHPWVGGTDRSLGPGCAGSRGFTATDLSLGAPTPGNSGFRLALFSARPGDTYLLALALSPLASPLDLRPFGAPGCSLHLLPTIAVSGGITGSGAGMGRAQLQMPIPAGVPKGQKVYRQWLLAHSPRHNPMGVTLSNARVLEIR